jgi:two-component system phosphate regulon response regulator OmpR
MRPGDRSLRIGVVEGDPGLRHFLERALLHLGHRVTLLNRAARLPDLVRPGAFDLLLLDPLPDGPGGCEVLEELYSKDVRTPAVLLATSLPSRSRSRWCMSARVTVLLKPFSLNELRAAVGAHRSFPAGPGE